jgi:chromosome segregation protein
MYLKSIEIHGFKSFANKIVLEFHNGITGIVGPNGSGKSNISDAVRWVLGEQSAKQLRGSKMEDIIFAGTQTRRPLGYAYVAITLDNTDHKLTIEYNQVTVARRVYRSGESEYLVNGNICRLRDVQELFMDTGIGKDGYSIIGQGQIDKILSGKPEDRRELFDEAAGIVKFKRRKIAAEKNLEEEKQNLCRITDILKEIENQLDPLKRQSAEAKVYIKLKEEQKKLEINQFLKEYERLEAVKGQTQERLSAAGSDYNITREEHENTKEEYLKLEKHLEECDLLMEEDKNTYNELKLKKEKAEGETKLLYEQISSAKQNEAYLQNSISTHENDIRIKKAEEQKYLSKKAVIDEKIASMDNLLNEAVGELSKVKENIIKYAKEIEECNADVYEYLNLNSGIKSSIQRYQTMLEHSNLRKAEINQKLLCNKSEEIQYTNAIETFTQSLRDISDRINGLVEQGDAMDKLITDTQAKIDSITSQYNEVQRQYLCEKSRMESLINLTQRYEGYGNSIKKVMELKRQMPGIIGVVADIIMVDKTYETAIETALGSTIQNIVTREEATAKKLISYLKKNKYGRATFLPLTNMNKSIGFRNDKFLNEKGVIGVASDLVEADPKFHALITQLLGKNIVVDHIDNAAELARKYNYTLRIVTVEGELLTPGGSISGGAYKNTSNLLGRRREIENIQEQAAGLKEHADELLNFKEIEKKNKAKFRQTHEEVKLSMQEKYLEQNTVKMNLDREFAKKAESEATLCDYMKELQEIEIQARDLKNNLSDLQINLDNNLEKNKEKELMIEQLTKQLEEEREKERLANDRAAGLKLDFSSLEQSKQYTMENIRRIKNEIERFYQELDILRADINKSMLLVEEKKQTISNTEAVMAACADSINIVDKKIREQSDKKGEITSRHKNFFNKREELSKRMNELDKEIYRLNTQLEKLMEQSDQLVGYMWEEYEITYTTACAYPIDTQVSLAQIKKTISEIKSRIKELGDVNVNSIEDYKNMSERHEFLTIQRDDLIKSEETLLQIITELDNEMRRQFKEKFIAINEQFDLVFKELFGGGKADLELTKDEDILEAGIRINAQPPGKKLQNMMQLSGGEKALTAISLLFAIQNLKPSPFCLLDEIEAALDDSNVERYANYLHKLTKDTQFIIITHRRGTMAAADILYGITMQEKGVSTLVSVNLIENELEK